MAVFGSIVSLAVNPANPADRLRVGGKQRLEDGGWGKHVDDRSSRLTRRDLGMLAIDPLAPDTVYAAAGVDRLLATSRTVHAAGGVVQDRQRRQHLGAHREPQGPASSSPP